MVYSMYAQEGRKEDIVVKVAYIRVSTEEQNTARQDAMMKAQGVEKVFTEKISGKNMERPQLQAMLDYVREGDVVFVESYSRLARSTADLLDIVDRLDKKGVGFVSLHENFDTTTPQGRLMVTIFAGLAAFEREQLLQRQREGIAQAKERGAYKGRQPIKVDDEAFTREVAAWKAGKQTARETMQKLGLKPNTFYRRVKDANL